MDLLSPTQPKYELKPAVLALIRITLPPLVVGLSFYFVFKSRGDYFGVDWYRTFYPATMLLLHGSNPYQVPTFSNPVWALIPLIPLALLGEEAGHVMLYFLTLACYSAAAWRLRANLLTVSLLLLSPIVIYAAYMGNLEGLVVFGFLVPTPVGLFFFAIKPQMGLAIMAYLACDAFRTGGLRRTVATVAPVCLAFAISFLIFGNWWSGRPQYVIEAPWNLSVFPWSVPVGLALFYLAIRRRQLKLSVPVSPLISPYLGLTSWSIMLFSLLETPISMFATFAATWMLFVAVNVLHVPL